MGKKNLLIGITGGMGAGKSALSRILSEAGYPVLSADEIAREITAAGSPGLAEVVQVFGNQALAPDGGLNRSWLRSEIARDPSARLRLEAITHPLIQKESRERSRELFEKGASIVFYEAPLLFEAKSETGMDKVICVHAPDEIRIDRVLRRDGRSREEIEKLMASQLPQEEKMRRADYLIENSGDEGELRLAAEKLLGKISEN